MPSSDSVVVDEKALGFELAALLASDIALGYSRLQSLLSYSDPAPEALAPCGQWALEVLESEGLGSDADAKSRIGTVQRVLALLSRSGWHPTGSLSRRAEKLFRAVVGTGPEHVATDGPYTRSENVRLHSMVEWTLLAHCLASHNRDCSPDDLVKWAGWSHKVPTAICHLVAHPRFPASALWAVYGATHCDVVLAAIAGHPEAERYPEIVNAAFESSDYLVLHRLAQNAHGSLFPAALRRLGELCEEPGSLIPELLAGATAEQKAALTVDDLEVFLASRDPQVRLGAVLALHHIPGVESTEVAFLAGSTGARRQLGLTR